MPASLTMTTKEQQNIALHGNNNNYKTNSSIELLGLESKQNSKLCKFKDIELIDIKFNELAKKISEELNQTQYSRDFFQAIDEIIKEPIRKTFERVTSKSHKINHHNLKYFNLQSSNNQRQQFRDNNGHQSGLDQPRSLPVEPVHINQERQQSLQQQIFPQRRQKSAIPKSNKPISHATTKLNNQQTTILSNTPINKPVTGSETTTLKRQQSLRSSYASVIKEDNNQQQLVNGQLYRKTRNYSANNILATNIGRSVVQDEADNDDNDDDDDDDDDDDEDYYEEYDGGKQCNLPDRPNQNTYLNHKLNPIAKSKTLSDTTNISEINKLTTHQSNAKLSAQQPHGQKLNPIVKSSTVSHTKQRIGREPDSSQDSESKSVVLTGKDFGSLYKPHMNYSTSVLGTHRLSDDDEIIIIPTQSPSLLSTSPDPDANLDELTERFSISRTKSFWEKLSKGNHSRRSSQVVSTDGSSIKQIQPIGKRTIGSRSSGHSHTLDRMDSTGGSNSNYSCSSSGDENGGSHSHQNPTISQLQEMSRQNRFRQTR